MMNNVIEQKVLTLEAASPEELAQILNSLPKDNKINSRPVVLSISGAQVMVRQFDLPRLSLRELKNSLKLEAVELLTLAPNEIELDYQVMESSNDKIKGIFVAAPKRLLEQYLSRLTKARLIPTAITAGILTKIDVFLSKSNAQNKNFYLLDFAAKNLINLAVFNKGQCELLREISFEEIDEAKREILHSLRYACGKSSSKHPEAVYILGDITDKNELISDLDTELNLKSEYIDLADVPADACFSKSYFNINLIRKYTFSFLIRKRISYALNFLIGIVFLSAALMAVKVIKTDTQIKNIKKDLNSFTKIANYDYIKGLQEKINLLSNEKQGY